MSNREKLLKRLSAAQFALWELHIYLNTHPNDTQALAMHNKYDELATVLRKEYEKNYGPLSPRTGQGNEWIKDPWPWDREEDFK